MTGRRCHQADHDREDQKTGQKAWNRWFEAIRVSHRLIFDANTRRCPSPRIASSQGRISCSARRSESPPVNASCWVILTEEAATADLRSAINEIAAVRLLPVIIVRTKCTSGATPPSFFDSGFCPRRLAPSVRTRATKAILITAIKDSRRAYA